MAHVHTCMPAGETVSTGALTLDLRLMSKVSVEAGGTRVRVQGGATVGM